MCLKTNGLSEEKGGRTNRHWVGLGQDKTFGQENVRENTTLCGM